MFYVHDLLEHLAPIRTCAEELGFRAAVGVSNLALDIEKNGAHVRFQPKFLYFDAERDGINYTPYFKTGALGFCGWLPYFNKVWPIALDKLAFKEFSRQAGLRTPPWWTEPSDEVTDFLVKAKGGSFGRGLRGPFRALDGDAPEKRLRDGEFYERFIPGRIAKIWYWDAEPRCLELLPTPTLTGDGQRSIRELIRAHQGEAHPNRDRWLKHQAAFTQLFAFQGKTLDSVLATGESVTAGIRYGGSLEKLDLDNRNVLDKHANTPLEAELRAIGQVLWQAIPASIRQGVVFTVDGVLDDEGKLWLLEVNPNPTVHPDVYPAMMKSVLSLNVSQMPSFSQRPDDPAFKGGLVWAPPGQSSKAPVPPQAMDRARR